MGIISTLIASSKTFNSNRNVGRMAAIRELRGLLQSAGDFDVPTALGAVNEVQSIAVHEAGTDGGTWELTITLNNGETITTAALDHDFTAAEVETAIDTAADGELTGFTAGDISVAGGPLTTTPMTLTFDGASVAGLNHPMAFAESIDLVDDATPTDAGAVTQSTAGHTARAAWALLSVLGIISGTIPEQGEDASAVTANISAGAMPHSLSQDTIKQLFIEIAVQDNNPDLVDTLNALFGY